MLKKIIEFSVRNKLIIGLMVIALVFTGIYQATKLPIDAVPDITDNQVLIITQAPAYGANDIERLITFPIEQANSNISGLKEMRSFSRFGLSLVTLVFEDDIDVYWARQQVSERLQTVRTQIPADIGNPELGPITTGLGEIYQYVLKTKKGYAHKYNAMDLRTIQDWIVKRQLIGVKGVAEVSSFGGMLKQYEVTVDPDKLHAYNVTINDVLEALHDNNENTGGAYIEKGPTVLYISSQGILQSIDDIKNIAIKKENAGMPILINQVADVRVGTATRYGALCYNDEGEATGALVMMLKGANSSKVIKDVKERIEQIKKTLPEGVEIEPFLDRTKMVNNAINTVEKNLLEGALIVILVLVLFLGNLRAGILVASVIPLAMLFAICMMNLFGVSGNLMSLGALDFGLIVDGAVIIVEAVMHQIMRTTNKVNLSKTEMDDTVIASSNKMMKSSIFGQLIILIVYLPIFSLHGIEGKMFKPMAQTVAFALLGAFILSITYIPMMSAWLLSRKKEQKNFSDKFMLRLENGYKQTLLKVMQFPKLVLSGVSILFIISIFILNSLGGEFIPELEEGDFAVDTRVLTGSNLNTSIAYTQKAAHILLKKFPEVEKVVTKIGSGEVPTDPMPMEAADMMVILKDKEKWTSAKNFNDLEEKMSEALADIPGITYGFQYPVQMRFNELMTGARQDVVCKIFGEDLDTLTQYANLLGNQIKTISGTEDLYVEQITGMPQVVIDYNRALLAQYNLSIVEVNKIVNTAFAGQTSGLIFEGEKRFDVVVKLNSNAKENIEDIRNLLIPLNNNLQIPLHQLANVSIKQSVNQIQRDEAKRRITIGFNIKNRDVQSIVNELKEKVDKNIKLPVGYYTNYGGSFENLLEAKNRLIIAVPIALLLIFVLLFFAFNNLTQSLIIYTAIPLSAIGGILFLALRQMPFSISAGIGFIALFGVAVLNGIVLIAEFNRLKNEGFNLKETVIIGAQTRLRPVLMTALVASLGFLPMALSNGAGAEVQRPLATVVIGGLLIATLLTLFVLPILYTLFDKKKLATNKIIPFVLLIIFSPQLYAQKVINLPQAITIAMQNNSTLKIDSLKSNLAKALIASAKTIESTSISTEIGQVNSAYFDSKIGISQHITHPKIYKYQKDIYNNLYNSSVLMGELNKMQLAKSVTTIFYQYQYLKQKEKLIQKSDSLFTTIYNKASLRLKLGETNVLEKASAQNHLHNLQVQLLQVRQELQVAVLQFQFLLNANNYEPIVNDDNKIALIDTANIENNSAIKVLKAEEENAQINTKLEKAKLLPSFNFGVNNNSFRGVGPDNNTYYGYNRFTSLQLGVDVPLFNKAQKEKIKSAQINEEISIANTTIKSKHIAQDMQIALTNYKSNKAILDLLRTEALINAKLIKETAFKQYTAGELNFIDYLLTLEQAKQIEDSYVEAINNLNKSIIAINFLTINN